MQCLSFRQPWLDAILYGGKRVENRVAWKGSKFRGDLLLHASSSFSRGYYLSVIKFLTERNISWRPKLPTDLVLGAVVGRAKVVDVILPGGYYHRGPTYRPSIRSDMKHPMAKDRWYMGEFALVLDEVQAFKSPIPLKGMMGLFEVDDALVAGAQVIK
jgi:hypothetical protein